MGEGEKWPGENDLREDEKRKLAELGPIVKQKVDLERRISQLDDLMKSFWDKEYPHPAAIQSALDYTDNIKSILEEMLERNKI